MILSKKKSMLRCWIYIYNVVYTELMFNFRFPSEHSTQVRFACSHYFSWCRCCTCVTPTLEYLLTNSWYLALVSWCCKAPMKVGIRFHEWSIMSHYHFCVRDTEAAKRSAQLKYSLGLQSIYNSSHITTSISGLSWFLPRIFSFPNDWLCSLPSVTDCFGWGRRQGVPHLVKPRLHPSPPPQ